MFRLAIRTVPVFAVILGFAVFLAAYMNFSGVRSAYLDIIRSRMAMTAQSIGNDVSTASTLGIPLAEQVTLPDLLARQAGADPLTLSIDVLSDSGKVVFSSDPQRTGSQDDAAGDPTAFRYEDRVTNDFGASIGTVVVRLDQPSISSEVDRLGLDILRGAVPIGMVAVVVGSLLCLLLFMTLRRQARHAAQGSGRDDQIGHASAEMERLQMDENK